MGKIEQTVIRNMDAAQLDAAYRSHVLASVRALPDQASHKLHLRRAESLLIAFQARPLAEKMDVIRARRNRI